VIVVDLSVGNPNASSSTQPTNQLWAHIEPILIVLIPIVASELLFITNEKTQKQKLEALGKKLEYIPKWLYPKEDLDTIRVNIMLPKWTHQGLRFKKKLQIVCDYNMDPYRRYDEKKLVWGLGEGASGEAMLRTVEYLDVKEWKPIIFDRRDFTSPIDLKRKAKIPVMNIDQTLHVLWVISIPIILEGRPTCCIGILNIDGVALLNDLGYDLMTKTASTAFSEKIGSIRIGMVGHIKDLGLLNTFKRRSKIKLKRDHEPF
jgi:hypothetical protein